MSIFDHGNYIAEDTNIDPYIEEVFVGVECLDEKYYEAMDQKIEIVEPTEYEEEEEEAIQENENIYTESLSFWEVHNLTENNEVETEEKVIENFVSKRCCQKNCVLHWTKEEILQFRIDCRRLDYFENNKNLLDTVLLGIIRSMCKSKKIVRHARKTIEKDRERLKLFFMFQGMEICETFFLFVHAIKIKRFRRLLKHYKNKGLQINVHGNTKKLPANAISLEHQSFVVKFIEKYAHDYGVLMPGVSYNIHILPDSATKVKVYRLYQNACKKRNIPHVGRSTFYSLWSQFCNNVVVQKPESSAGNTASTSDPSNSKPKLKKKKNKINIEEIRNDLYSMLDPLKVEVKQMKTMNIENVITSKPNTVRAKPKRKKKSKKKIQKITEVS